MQTLQVIAWKCKLVSNCLIFFFFFNYSCRGDRVHSFFGRTSLSFTLAQIRPFTVQIAILVIDKEHEMDNLLVQFEMGHFAQGEVDGSCGQRKNKLFTSTSATAA